MKLIVVSQRVDLYPDRGERRDALDQRLCQWLSKAGYLPVPVPNCLRRVEGQDAGYDRLLYWLGQLNPAAVVLSGGNDPGEAVERDETERELLSYAQSSSLPVLGICRGMQMMGIFAGGTLVPVHGHAATRHLLQGEMTDEVNSYHNYALAACPADFVVTAMAPDGCIEAIRHKHMAWEGWMWHPEREPELAHIDIIRLRKLIGD